MGYNWNRHDYVAADEKFCFLEHMGLYKKELPATLKLELKESLIE